MQLLVYICTVAIFSKFTILLVAMCTYCSKILCCLIDGITTCYSCMCISMSIYLNRTVRQSYQYSVQVEVPPTLNVSTCCDGYTGSPPNCQGSANMQS